MKKWPFDQIFRMVIACCCLMVIGVLSVTNLPLMTKPVDGYLQGETTFEEMTETIASGLVSDDLAEKDGFVNLNGLMARVTGRRVYNNAILLNNGMLARTESVKMNEMIPAAEKIVTLADWLADQETPFLYVMPPLKPDLAGTLLPVGVENDLNDKATAFLELLMDGGVAVHDLRKDLSADAEQVGRYYYRTDHHWAPDGAMAGYEILMRRLSLMDTSLTTAHADIGQWERHLKENWFLGSVGRRVGSLYAGTDPLIWYTPRFETAISCIVPDRKHFYKGDFTQAMIRERYIKNVNYFHMNPYCVYIGGDYPLVKHKNAQAANRRRILVIKDSYVLPLQSFLSTEFTEVDVIDPRYYTQSSIADYCRWNKPDFVVMMMNPMSVRELTNTVVGIKKGKIAAGSVSWKPCLEEKLIRLTASASEYHNAQLDVELTHGRTYRFSCDDILLQEGDAAGASIVLYNATKRTRDQMDIADIGYCHQQGGTDWAFTVPSDDSEYQLLIYAGIHGETSGIGLTYTGVTVSVLE